MPRGGNSRGERIMPFLAILTRSGHKSHACYQRRIGRSALSGAIVDRLHSGHQSCARESICVEAISTFDIFKIGVGPSSSHTMGPWRAAQAFLGRCRALGAFDKVERVRIDLFGSLAKTGKGHGTDIAVLLGLTDEDPVTCDTSQIQTRIAAIVQTERLSLGGCRAVPFRVESDLVFHRDVTLPFHPNAVRFTASLIESAAIVETYFSIGGGFIVQESDDADKRPCHRLPMPIESAAELLGYCCDEGLTIPQVVWRNELSWRDADEIQNGLTRIWATMKACIFRGCQTDGILPGQLGVVRRAAKINRTLLGGRRFESIGKWSEAVRASVHGFRETLKWVSGFALAVNEENAAFGRVVTAPTNGAAGVVPAVLMYYTHFSPSTESGVFDFLLTAGEIGSLFKKGATLSAAMGGCQAEIGVSSAMAAAGLTQCLGGTPEQVLMAAEIAMEHHLGLTCDPVAGLVQIPCIERNSMGAIKAITACNLALESNPADAKVSLDAVIRSMWQTALDMNTKYKETSEGGLAIQIPVNLAEC
jgi:L-serine dehydratase